MYKLHSNDDRVCAAFAPYHLSYGHVNACICEDATMQINVYLTNHLDCLIRVGGIAPMGGAKRAPLILANIELCGSIWRSNDSLQHTKDLSTDEDVLI